ncbi:hypothetical protein N657DRAFT_643405 [Parathielavia appendiculata]|uniref:Uncharacterized protein n=1 Tax=Parathielavia appendiculata TaxID=2587402 RepID=A0AAN6Z655_9PEZI|nr:hypothetical protein N657DRAFT_643405 [Parathielavia appendiculata]
MTSFYWFTDSYERAMWAYRQLMCVVDGDFPVLAGSVANRLATLHSPLSLGSPAGMGRASVSESGVLQDP